MELDLRCQDGMSVGEGEDSEGAAQGVRGGAGKALFLDLGTAYAEVFALPYSMDCLLVCTRVTLQFASLGP